MFIDEPPSIFNDAHMYIYIYIFIYLFIWDWLNPHELYVMYDVTTLCWDISRLLRFLRPQIPVDYIQFTRAGVGIDRSLVTGRTFPMYPRRYNPDVRAAQHWFKGDRLIQKKNI